MPRFKVLCPLLRHDADEHGPGAVLELSDAQAASLLALNAIKRVDENTQGESADGSSGTGGGGAPLLPASTGTDPEATAVEQASDAAPPAGDNASADSAPSEITPVSDAAGPEAPVGVRRRRFPGRRSKPA